MTAALKDLAGQRARVTEPAVTTASSKPRRRKDWAPGKDLRPPPLGAEVLNYLARLTLAQLICLAYGHVWPILVPGRGRPRGWHAGRAGGQHDGAFLITEDCVRDVEQNGRTCGARRSSYTGRHGIFMVRGVHRQYAYAESWEVRPLGSRITRLDVIDYITWLMSVSGELFDPESLQPGEGGLA